MEHDRAEALISERMDGALLARRSTDALERHLVDCAACRAFERDAFRVRDAVRFEVAPPVPDVAERVMALVAGERWRAPRPRGVPSRRYRVRSRLLVPALAATVVGALTGSLVVGGPWRDEARPTAIAATTIADGVASAATAIEAYEARYTIVERDPRGDVRSRELEMHVWFDAPERFRLDVVDLTAYPSPTTPTDLRLIVDGTDWHLSAPTACPRSTCPTRDVRVRNRAPYSSAAPMPTDVVLPLTTLADAPGIRVGSTTTILGRAAVEVVLPFERAEALFPFVSLVPGGWRPFFARDPVHVWVDRDDWFPLRWEVYPADGEARDAWALRFGLPDEPPTRRIFSVAATDVAFSTPSDAVFTVPSAADVVRDQGSVAATLSTVEREVGFAPTLPESVHGLDLYRVAVQSPTGSSFVTYADGVSYLTIGETRSWRSASPFGITDAARPITLGGGVGYYAPSDGAHGRRLAIHAEDRDLYLETNLARADLLAVAASIGVVPEPFEGLAP